MAKYITKAGDMWDSIAYSAYGSCRYTDILINNNRDKLEHFVFSAGVEIDVPELQKETRSYLPPWKQYADS